MTENSLPSTCANCDAPVSGRYCVSCGQDQVDPRQAISQWVAKILQDEFSLDGRLPRTVVTLFRHPGRLTADWLAGRRGRHLHPFRLYLIASVSLFTVTFLMGLPLTGQGLELPEFGIGQTLQEVTANAVAGRLQTLLTVGALVLVPVFALWLRLILRRSSHLLVDHLVFSLHQHSALMLLLTAAWPILFFVPPKTGWLLLAGSAVVHAILAYRTVYAREKWILRGILAGGGWGFALVGLTAALAAAVMPLVNAQNLTIIRDRAARVYVESRRAPEAVRDAAIATELGRVSLRWFEIVLQNDGRFLLGHDSVHIAELRVDLGQIDASVLWLEKLSADYPSDVTVAGLSMRVALETGDTVAARGHAVRLLRLEAPIVTTMHGRSAKADQATARGLVEAGG